MANQTQPVEKVMTKAELAASDAALETYYKRLIKFGGFRAQVAKNERDEAVNNREALAAKIDVYQVKGKLKLLAEQEGIELDVSKEKPARSEEATPTTYSSSPEITYPEKAEAFEATPGTSHTEA